ncbi:glycerate kinase [Kaistia dalseonensis]|uniref:Hydroxypyruvate reductase n=1 Tax=Kaistia dalseonensis TaxID=410840 RepID=A0ABU0HDM8_9HYPH|nr:glycerate kinase [Kaistia dalseonensis]MCX5497776.1 glycerate kinase [Kaistia dalseonensis]MDQ0440420.1 hydroxypyruvate reductase [Kaistia dalseonensis]
MTFASSDKTILLELFNAALAASLPDGRYEGRLPEPPRGRTIVLGAGKGAARMAKTFEDAWEKAGHGLPQGLVVTRYGHGMPTRSIEVVEASHPVPDAAGMQAAERILALAREAGPDDLVVFLMSGGASALLSLPAEGLTLEDKQTLNRALLKSGAPIGAMNRVRKSASAIKGGRLAAAAAPARMITYLISDVPGDDPGAIGSGPTIPEASDPDAALAILAEYGIAVDARVEAAIRANAVTAGAGGPVEMLATPKMALDAAAAVARKLGLNPIVLGDALEGEARDVAKVLAAIAHYASAHDEPVAKPAVILSGGETTVTVRGKGRGGRNAEFLLSLAVALGSHRGIAAIACDTDGIDGSEDNAGAWLDEHILTEARSRGLDPAAHLANNDGYGFFEALDRLVVTGPTLTNVNDFRAILVR